MDVTGEEFERFMELAGKLQYTSTPEGAQEMVDLVTKQAELGADFLVSCTVVRLFSLFIASPCSQQTRSQQTLSLLIALSLVSDMLSSFARYSLCLCILLSHPLISAWFHCCSVC